VFSAVYQKNTHVETLPIFYLWQLLQKSFTLTQFNIAILAGVVNFYPTPTLPLVRGGSKKLTNDLGLLYFIGGAQN
jgi:multisubunit Na+/H+ antiporter MnhE subunit